jgi:hypothetical protein
MWRDEPELLASDEALVAICGQPDTAPDRPMTEHLKMIAKKELGNLL